MTIHPRLALIPLALLLTWGLIPETAPAPVTFEDIAPRARVDFVLRNSAMGDKHQIETMVSGVAIFDYNNDGRPDIYFVNGARQPALAKSDPSFYNRLYRNNGDGTFTDVTEAAGVRGHGFETGVAVGDYDNDGYPDLFIAGVNRNTLYHNRGDGTFEDVTEKAGLLGLDAKGNKPWSISAGWFDYDNDGRLDLLVVNYVAWSPSLEEYCSNSLGAYRSYCHPKVYKGLPNLLYHNNGDGTFTDVSVASGIGKHVGKGMGVAFADYDNDGRMDVFVSNDNVPNFLFHNQGGGRFDEVALWAGVALDDYGRPVSSMGVDFRDLDNDGREDIVFADLAGESFQLFRNLGKGDFLSATFPSGLAQQSRKYTGWSLGAFDLNNDGLKDLFAAAGDINDNTELYSPVPSKMRNAIFVNQGGLRFLDRSAEAGPDFQKTGLHRGAAFGDLDGDGRIDVVVSRIGEPAEVWHNTSPRLHWLALRLTGRRSNRDGIGAKIHIIGQSGREQWNHVTTSTGYGCSSDRTVHFGLGQDAVVRSLEIRWPSGTLQKMENLRADRLLSVEEPAPLKTRHKPLIPFMTDLASSSYLAARRAMGTP